MNIPKAADHLVFTLLLIIVNTIAASPLPHQRIIRINRSSNQTSTNRSPYWEYILREFVFKTLSSPPKTSNILYKKLLEAPFYGGPLPAPSNEENSLLSRGNVYHLPDGQWILCQDNCNNCILCNNQKNSIVKWTLSRIKRPISADSYRYDLQLTVIPQLNNGALNKFQTGNYIYVPYKSIVSTDTTVTTAMTHIDRSRSGRSWRRMQRDEHGQIDRSNDVDNLKSTSDYSNLSSTLNHHDNMTDSKDFKPTHRLIMGIDQSGKKHVIHVVSIGPSVISNNDDNNNNSSDNTVDYKFDRNIRGPSYQQYINKLLETIHSHRPIIDTFLSYERIKNDHSTASLYPVYSEYINSDNSKNDDSIPKLNSNFEQHNKNTRPQDWSQILTRISRNKNYIPKLVKKFNGNLTTIIRSKSISLF